MSSKLLAGAGSLSSRTGYHSMQDKPTNQNNEPRDDSTGEELSPVESQPSTERFDPVDDSAAVPLAELLTGQIPLPDDRREALIMARQLIGRSGPLPSATELADYDDAHPGTAKAIIADFERRSLLEAEIVRHEMAIEDRELHIEEREQELRFSESKDDLKVRWFVITYGLPLLLVIVLLAFAFLFWGPGEFTQWRVLGAVILIFPAIGLIIALIRGRMSQHERDVIISTFPAWMESLPRWGRQAPDAQSSPSPKSIPPQASEADPE